MVKPNPPKDGGGKPRVLASSEKPRMTPRRAPRSPSCRIDSRLETDRRIGRGVKMFRIALIIAFSAWLAADAIQVYKWVDEDGNVYYSDQAPPEGQEAEELILDSTPSAADVRDAQERTARLKTKQQTSQNQRSEERQSESAAKEGKRAAQVARDDRCLEARKQLISLQQRLPVYRDEEGIFRTLSVYNTYEGEREYLDDATRALEIDRVRHDVTTNCEHPDDPKKQFLASRERMKSMQCETARADLKAKQRADAKSPRQSIEDARDLVEKYCEIDN